MVRRLVPSFAAVAVAVALALGVTSASPAGSAAPAAVPTAKRVGKVVYTGLETSPPSFSLALTSFSWGVSVASGAGGGGGTGKATYDKAEFTQDAGPSSALLASRATRGLQLGTVVVTLYQPSSTKVAERWTFDNTRITSLVHGTSGPATASTNDKVSITFTRVSGEFYAADGKTVVRTYCFDAATTQSCGT